MFLFNDNVLTLDDIIEENGILEDNLKIIPTKLGTCKCIYGPMFSSKTTDLIAESEKLSIAMKNHLIISNIKDKKRSFTRINKSSDVFIDDGSTYCEGYITTFSGTKRKCILLNNLMILNILIIKTYFEYVIIDEGHLYEEGSLSKIVLNLIQHGINVYISGLLLSSDLEMFEEMTFINAISDEKIEKKAVCSNCNNMKATLNYKKEKNKQKIQIGSDNIYISVCRLCYFILNNKKYT